MRLLAFALCCITLWILFRPRRRYGLPTPWELILRGALMSDQGRPESGMDTPSLDELAAYEERKRAVTHPRRQRRATPKVVRIKRTA